MASITRSLGGSTGGGGSIVPTPGSEIGARIPYYFGSYGVPATELTSSQYLYFDDAVNRLNIGDSAQNDSTINAGIFGNTDSDAALHLYSTVALPLISLFKVYANGRIDVRTIDSSGVAVKNIFIGFNCGSNASTAEGNTGLGYESLLSLSTGIDNTAVGQATGQTLTTGERNTFAGAGSGLFMVGALENSFFGAFSGRLSNANQNTYIGAFAGENNASGDSNTYLGYAAGRYRNLGLDNTGSINCIFIGSNTRSLTATDDNSIVIGNGVTSSGSNTITIGNATHNSVYIRGNFFLYDAQNINIQTGTGTKIGTATNQKLAFWNKTPIVQPTTAITGATFASPGSGLNIKTDDTWGGYTIGQVVAALINTGILA